MDTQTKIAALKKADWQDPELISVWEKMLFEINAKEEYLKLPQTRTIIESMKQSIREMDLYFSNLDQLNINQIQDINSLFALRKCYRALLIQFGEGVNLEGERSNIIQQIDNAFERIIT